MAKSNQELGGKMALAAAQRSEAPTQEVQKFSINNMLMQSVKQFEMALKGSGEDANRFARICLSVVKNNDNLTKIAISNPTSIIAACMDIASFGVDPSIPNEVFLIPYGSEAKAQLGYKGLAKLARRAAKIGGDPLRTLRCDAIYENDVYERESGYEITLIHKPPKFGAERGKVIGYYALYETAGGARGYIEMTVEQVREHQRKFCKSLNNSKSPYYNGQNFDAYGLKTVLRRLISKELEMTNKLASAITSDDDDDGENYGAVKIAPRDTDVIVEPTPTPSDKGAGEKAATPVLEGDDGWPEDEEMYPEEKSENK